MIKFFLFILLLVSQCTLAQMYEIKGKVINGEDNSPLAAASVFINNSTKGTICNSDGTFVLGEITQQNFELVISYAGFSTLSFRITPENRAHFFAVKLFPRKEQMEGINVLTPEKDAWKTWGLFFSETFLGQSDFAKECVIENPKSIKIIHDRNRNVLTAYSDGQIIITNKALGYTLKYQLEDFEYDFKLQATTYLGYAVFQNLKGGKRKASYWQRNRKEVYLGSLQYFMRSLYADSVVAHHFDVRQKVRISNKDSAFSQIYQPGNTPRLLKKEGEEYRIVVPEIPAFKKIPDYIDLVNTRTLPMKDLVTTSSGHKNFYFENYLQVIYLNANVKMDYLLFNHLPKYLKMPQSSDVFMLTDEPLTVEKDGSYFNPVNMISSGYWGWFRMAEMLPTDYQPAL